MKTVWIAANAVLRLLRDRSNIFFVFLFPMLLILVLGAAFGGDFDPRLGVVGAAEDAAEGTGEGAGDGGLAEELADEPAAADGIEVVRFEEREALVHAVERGRLEAGVVLPEDYEERLLAGDEVSIEFVSGPNQDSRAVRNTVDAAITEQGALLRAAAFAAERTGLDHETALERAREIAEASEGTTVERTAVGEPFELATIGQFDMGAYSQLILFVFLTSLTGSTALIQARQLGVTDRMLSTPTRVSSILFGEAVGRFAVAMVQGAFIMLGSALMFGVDWGDPIGAVAILVVFSAGAAGAGMLMGSTLRNDQQAGGVGVLLGLGLAALGGSMFPLSVMKVFAPTMYRVAHVTPHAWGIEAFEELIVRGGGLGDIMLELGILTAFAVLMYALAVWRLRVTLLRS